MAELELVKLAATGGGGVACCVVLVILFLRFIRESQEASLAKVDQAIRDGAARSEAVITDITSRHSADMRESREAFQAQIEALTSRVFVVIEGTSDAVRENAVAVKSLEHAVRDLQVRIGGGDGQ